MAPMPSTPRIEQEMNTNDEQETAACAHNDSSDPADLHTTKVSSRGLDDIVRPSSA